MSAGKSTETSAIKSTDKPAEKSTDKPADKPAKKSTEKPDEKLTLASATPQTSQTSTQHAPIQHAPIQYAPIQYTPAKLKKVNFVFISLHDDVIADYRKVLESTQLSNFSFICTDITAEMATGDYDAVVSPANSFGFMGGGVDAYYIKYFGEQLQAAVQDTIRMRYHGELPIGRSLTIKMGDKRKPQYFIVAPTMREPENVAATINAYYSFKAILEAIEKNNEIESEKADPRPIKKVLVPCLATGVGCMPAVRSAWQVKMAYDAFNGISYIGKNASGETLRSITDLLGPDNGNWLGVKMNSRFMKSA